MTDKINDGGPAFPTLGDEFMKTPDGGMAPKSNYGMEGAQGMSLRDWLAGLIVQGYVTRGFDNTMDAIAKEAKS